MVQGVNNGPLRARDLALIGGEAESDGPEAVDAGEDTTAPTVRTTTRRSIQERKTRRQRFQARQPLQQFRARLDAQLKPKAIKPDGPFVPQPPNGLPVMGDGPGPDQGAGGKGGIFGKDSKENAARALGEEPTPDSDHPFVQEKATTRRRLDQVGLLEPSGDRIYVHDLDQAHGEQVTRTIAGQTGLAQGADITADLPPQREAYAEGKQRLWQETANPFGKEDPTVADFAAADVETFPGNVIASAIPISRARLDVEQKGDGKKTFMNMSHGFSPEMAANRTAARMMLAKPGSALHAEAVSALGREPNVRQEGDRLFPSEDDMATLKEKAIYPAMRKEMARPDYQEAMGHARGVLEQEVALAREQGIMVFQSAMNDHERAAAGGDPMMSETVTAGIPGIVRVGATRPNGPGTADDTMAPFSGEGPVTASATGMGIPVGVDKNGKIFDVDGTSFASPIMTETAYAMSAANPDLSLDQIEGLLTDPRVARDIPGTTRDGAGVIDQFSAVMVAKDPSLTAAQIDGLRAQLDADPTGKYRLEGGQLRRR